MSRSSFIIMSLAMAALAVSARSQLRTFLPADQVTRALSAEVEPDPIQQAIDDVPFFAPYVHEHGMDRHAPYIDALGTDHAYVERKLRVDFTHAHHSDDGAANEYGLEAEFQWAFNNRLAIGGAFPLIYRDNLHPEDGEPQGAVAFEEFEIEPEFLMVKSDGFLLSLAAGVAFPGGAADRGIGEDSITVHPTLLSWIGLGPRTSLQLEAGVEIPVEHRFRVDYDEGEETRDVFTWSTALAHTFTDEHAGFFSFLTPMMELGGDVPIDGDTARRGSLHLIPGVRFEPVHDLEVGLGVSIPLTDEREADWTAIGSVVFHF